MANTPAPVPLSALPVGSVLLWPPQGAGDFADLAWVVGEALGNVPGVRALDVSYRLGVLQAQVWAGGPQYVRHIGAGFGWAVQEAERHAGTQGEVAGVLVSVSWVAPRPGE